MNCEHERLPSYPKCIACGQDNECGLKIKLYFDKNTNVVSGRMTFDEKYVGYADIIHGGIVTTALDETMAWAGIKMTRRMCLTKSLNVTFNIPVRAGTEYVSIAEMEKDNISEVVMNAKLIDTDGKICAEARGVFIKMNERRSNLMMESMV